MRVFFAGTPQISVPTLTYLASRLEVTGVLCNPDAPAGRGRALRACPVKEEALRLNIPVFQPQKLDEAAISEISALQSDVMVCFAYGKIFRKRFLDLFPLGALNAHPSLLPRWRGPTPMQAALIAGDTETGITIQRMALKMDAGAILVNVRIPLNVNETITSLEERVAPQVGAMVERGLNMIAANPEAGEAQNEDDVTYCSLLEKQDGELDFLDIAVNLERKIRALNPWPGTYATLDSGEIIHIKEASVIAKLSEEPTGTVLECDRDRGFLINTSDGILAVTRLQMTGKKPLSHIDFANGRPRFVGCRFI